MENIYRDYPKPCHEFLSALHAALVSKLHGFCIVSFHIERINFPFKIPANPGKGESHYTIYDLYNYCDTFHFSMFILVELLSKKNALSQGLEFQCTQTLSGRWSALRHKKKTLPRWRSDECMYPPVN